MEPNLWELIAISHEQASLAPHDLEDTMMIQLTRREIWLVLYGMLWTSAIADDLEDSSCTLLEKFSEILDIQKPHWRTEDDGEAEA